MASLGETTTPMPLKKEASRSAAQAPTGMERWSGGAVVGWECLKHWTTAGGWYQLSLLVQFTFFVSAVANKAQATEVSLWRENTTVWSIKEAMNYDILWNYDWIWTSPGSSEVDKSTCEDVKVAPDVNIFWSPVASSMPRSLARLSIKGISLDHCMCYSAAKQSPRTGAVAVGPVSTFLVAIQPSLRILVGRARASITSCLWLLQGFSHKKNNILLRMDGTQMHPLLAKPVNFYGFSLPRWFSVI